MVDSERRNARWDGLEEALRDRELPSPGVHPASRCSVAAVLCFEGPPSVLLMKRAVRPGDPWSGHISFPGGKWRPEDVDLVATAIRETTEEVGVYLERDDLVAGMPPQSTHLGGVEVSPFVFRVPERRETTLGIEADASFWMPLDPVVAGELDAEFRWDRGDHVRRMPSWEYDGHVVWGLTYRILADLLEAVRTGP